MNFYRMKHGVPGLRQDRKLSRHAQNRAEFYAEKQKYIQNVNEGTGFVWKTSKQYPMPKDKLEEIISREIVDTWYKESKHYKNYTKDPLITGKPKYKTIEHFTQMVWKATTHFGAGMATSRKGTTYVVVFFSPVGNMKGRFVKNVLPPKALGPKRHL